MVLLCQTGCDFQIHPQSIRCDSAVNTAFHISLPHQAINLWRMGLWLSSSELWYLAHSRETRSVSSGCLNRLLPTSFSPFHFARISANWPRTFPLSLSWPVEIRMLTKPLREFGVIRPITQMVWVCWMFFRSLHICSSIFITLSIRRS